MSRRPRERFSRRAGEAPRRIGAVTLALGGLVLVALTACGQTGGGMSGAAPAGKGSASPTSGTQADRADQGSDGCPARASALEEAVKAHDGVGLFKDFFQGRSGSLRTTQCYQGYAEARTIGDPADVQPVTVLFGYDATARAWQPLMYGTSSLCEGQQIPRGIRQHLGGCMS